MNEVRIYRIKLFSLLLMLVIFLFSFVSCSDHKFIYKDTRLYLDTAITIKIVGSTQDSLRIQGIADSCYIIFAYYDSTLDYLSPSSMISKINSNLNNTIDTDLYEILDSSFIWEEKTGGEFSVKVGEITSMWKFDEEHFLIPDSQIVEIKQNQFRRLYKNVNLSNNSIEKPDSIKLDLGAVAKGFVLSKVRNYMETVRQSEPIIDEYLIDAGRSLCGYRNKNNKEGYFNFGLTHPRDNEKLAGTFLMPSEMTCASCGDYERFVIINDIRYHHVINPSTGYPARKSIGATVICKSAITADILSTAVFVLGPTDGLELINKTENTEAIVFYEENDTISYKVSNGMIENYKLTINNLN